MFGTGILLSKLSAGNHSQLTGQNKETQDRGHPGKKQHSKSVSTRKKKKSIT